MVLILHNIQNGPGHIRISWGAARCWSYGITQPLPFLDSQWWWSCWWFIQYMKQKRCTDDDNDKTKDVCCDDDYPPVWGTIRKYLSSLQFVWDHDCGDCDRICCIAWSASEIALNGWVYDHNMLDVWFRTATYNRLGVFGSLPLVWEFHKLKSNRWPRHSGETTEG